MNSDTPETPQPADRNRPRVVQSRRSTKRPKVPRALGGLGAYVDTSAVKHQGRVLAMQSLFEMDLAQHGMDDIIERIEHDDTELPSSAIETPDEDEAPVDDIPEPVADHAIMLIRGVQNNLDQIDPVIEKAAPQFPVAQLANVDRNVLRLAIYELNHQSEVPFKVVINEAVEIAKRFGGPNSGKFVNGVLGTISKSLPKERRETGNKGKR